MKTLLLTKANVIKAASKLFEKKSIHEKQEKEEKIPIYLKNVFLRKKVGADVLTTITTAKIQQKMLILL